MSEQIDKTKSWSGSYFLGTHAMLYVGPVAATSAHAHHAYQVLWTPHEVLDLLAAGDSAAVACHAAVIPPDVEHRVEGSAQSVWLLYIDPESDAGRRLKRKTTLGTCPSVWRDAGARLLETPRPDSPTSWAEAAARIDLMTVALLGTILRPSPMHPAVSSTLRRLAAASQSRPTLSQLASHVHLSPSRLSHLFNEQVGVSLRSYVLWQRLGWAARCLERGETITECAHSAGFADGAHLTRTFKRMFGVTPSEVARFATWVVEA